MSATVDENAILCAIGFKVKGTGGDGVILLPKQVVPPSKMPNFDLILYNENENLTWNAREFKVSVDTSTITNNRVITLPDVTDTLVARASADTLANKTLIAPTISSITNGGALTLPTGTDTLVGRSTFDILTNKTIADVNLTGRVTLFGARVQIYSFDGFSTSAATPVIIASYELPPERSPLMVETVAYANCTESTAGNVGKVRGFVAVFIIKNVVGTLTATQVHNSANGDSNFAVAHTVTTSGATVQIQFMGIANSTISYAGRYTLSYA